MGLYSDDPAVVLLAEPVSDSQYLLPTWVAPFKGIWRAYITRSIRAELGDVELLARYRHLSSAAAGVTGSVEP